MKTISPQVLSKPKQVKNVESKAKPKTSAAPDVSFTSAALSTSTPQNPPAVQKKASKKRASMKKGTEPATKKAKISKGKKHCF